MFHSTATSGALSDEDLQVVHIGGDPACNTSVRGKYNEGEAQRLEAHTAQIRQPSGSSNAGAKPLENCVPQVSQTGRSRNSLSSNGAVDVATVAADLVGSDLVGSSLVGSDSVCAGSVCAGSVCAGLDCTGLEGSETEGDGVDGFVVMTRIAVDCCVGLCCCVWASNALWRVRGG